MSALRSSTRGRRRRRCGRWCRPMRSQGLRSRRSVRSRRGAAAPSRRRPRSRSRDSRGRCTPRSRGRAYRRSDLRDRGERWDRCERWCEQAPAADAEGRRTRGARRADAAGAVVPEGTPHNLGAVRRAAAIKINFRERGFIRERHCVRRVPARRRNERRRDALRAVARRIARRRARRRGASATARSAE